jgi:hypothetical protein
MKNKLILFTCLIALGLTAHTQQQSNDSTRLKRLDSLSVEHRLVVLAVTKMDYLNTENSLLKKEVKLLTTMNTNNVNFIRQIVGDKQAIEEKLSKEAVKKKKWRNATLFLLCVNVGVILALLH